MNRFASRVTQKSRCPEILRAYLGHSVAFRRVLAVLGIIGVLSFPQIQASAVVSSGGYSHASNQTEIATHVSVSGPSSSTSGQAEAVLTGVDAGSIPMTVSLGDPVVVATSSGSEYSVTAVVGLGQSNNEVRPMTQFSGNACGYDGSISVYECVTMYYNIKSDSSIWFADDHQDSIQAINYDTHDAVLSSLSLTTGGSGEACNGTGELQGGQTWNIGTPTSGTVYYKTPSFSGNYYRIWNEFVNFENVQGTLNWHYKGNAEQLSFTYTLPDHEAGWPTGGCSN
jgi:hypothetical protein